MLEGAGIHIKKVSSQPSSSCQHQPVSCVGATLQRAWEDVGITLMWSDLWPAAPAAAQVEMTLRLPSAEYWWSFLMQLSDALVVQALRWGHANEGDLRRRHNPFDLGKVVLRFAVKTGWQSRHNCRPNQLRRPAGRDVRPWAILRNVQLEQYLHRFIC